MRNISVGQSADPAVDVTSRPDILAGAAADGQTQARDRANIRQLLVDEMTSWSPRDRGGVFKAWHQHALSLVHLNVLTALEAEGPLSMTRLAQAMDVSDASATGIIDRMEKRGLVERRHDTSDRRKVLVHQTEAGTRVFKDMTDHRRGVLTMVLDELTEDEMTSLLIGYRAITAARKRVIAREVAGRAQAGDETAETRTNT